MPHRSIPATVADSLLATASQSGLAQNRRERRGVANPIQHDLRCSSFHVEGLPLLQFVRILAPPSTASYTPAMVSNAAALTGMPVEASQLRSRPCDRELEK